MNKNLHELHIELWMWMHDNPAEEKEHWPKWASIKKETGFIGECFACAVADLLFEYETGPTPYNDDECKECPLQWENNMACNDEGSYYERWAIHKRLLLQAISKYPELVEKYTLQVKTYAKIIAETPWKGDTDYNILMYEEAGGKVKTMLTRHEVKKANADQFETAKIYYLKDAENKSRITVCLLRNGPRTARGVAFCSMKDQPIKKVGRAKAFGRAKKALCLGSNSGETNRDDCLEVMSACGELANFSFKSEYCPELSDFEEKLMAGKLVTNGI